MKPDRLRRLFARYVAFAERRTGALLLALALLAALAAIPTARLSLHTDMAELLPDNHPAVLALRRISGRQKASTNLVVLIESPDGDANRRFAEALRQPLEAMVPDVFSEVQWRSDPDLPDYAARWRWLYADPGDLDQAEELLDRLIARRAGLFTVDLEGDPERELKELRQRLDQRLPQKVAGDYFLGEE